MTPPLLSTIRTFGAVACLVVNSYIASRQRQLDAIRAGAIRTMGPALASETDVSKSCLPAARFYHSAKSPECISL